MNNKSETERVYETIGKDSQAWLAQARELRLSADVILPRLEEALSLPPSSLGAQEKRLAYVHSYMLLNGLAFENLIKGIFIGRAPALVTKEKVKSGILERGGHGIANGAKEIISLSTDEVDLLKRLEEYLFWAGRYPLPMKLGIYLNSETQELRRFQTNDPALINQVFNRLIIVLEQEWKARS